MNMDMSSMSSSMTMSMNPTGTMSSMIDMATMASATAAMASATGDMSGMDMGGGSMSKCKISMLWNWNVVDSCFLAETWHITSRGMFGGSCVGVVCLTVCLEFLRRLNREYDRYLARNWEIEKKRQQDLGDIVNNADGGKSVFTSRTRARGAFPITSIQIIVRSVIYAVIVGVSYILMLLAMYFNGYIFFSIVIGALIGSILFGSDQVIDRSNQENGSCCC